MNKVWTYISEEKVAKKLIENKKNINENTMQKLIAYVKYLKNEENLSKDKIRIKIDELMEKNYIGYVADDWDKKLQGIVNKYTKVENREMKKLNTINITEKELKFIEAFKDENKELLLFTMLVIAKSYHKADSVDNEGNIIKYGYWVNTDSVSLFKLAKFKYKCRQPRMLQREYCINDLSQQDDVIYISDVCDSNSIKLLYVDESESDIILNFDITEDNMDEIVGYYLKWKNPEGYTRCEDCGNWIKKTNNRIKRCKKCKKKLDNNLSKLNMQKKRKNVKR